MRQLHFDLLRLLKDDQQGSHGSRRARRYVLAQAADTVHELGFRGLRPIRETVFSRDAARATNSEATVT